MFFLDYIYIYIGAIYGGFFFYCTKYMHGFFKGINLSHGPTSSSLVTISNVRSSWAFYKIYSLITGHSDPIWRIN